LFNPVFYHRITDQEIPPTHFTVFLSKKKSLK